MDKLSTFLFFLIIGDVFQNVAGLADISLLMEVAQKLTGQLERGEINNAILLTGDEVDKELPELPELPNGYMNPDEREQQRQDFQELP